MIDLQPVKGTRDFFPDEMRLRNWLFEVWRNVSSKIDLSLENTVVILGTGNERDNLRTALWIKQQYPKVLVYTRSNSVSKFAMSVAEEKDLHAFSINQLVEDMIPNRWTR